MKTIQVKIPLLTIRSVYLEFPGWLLGTLKNIIQGLKEFFRPTAEGLKACVEHERYYSIRVPDLQVLKIGEAALWFGTCPICLRHTLWIAPAAGRWTCQGPCSTSGGPELMEYLVGDSQSAAEAEEVAALLMGRPVIHQAPAVAPEEEHP